MSDTTRAVIKVSKPKLKKVAKYAKPGVTSGCLIHMIAASHLETLAEMNPAWEQTCHTPEVSWDNRTKTGWISYHYDGKLYRHHFTEKTNPVLLSLLHWFDTSAVRGWRTRAMQAIMDLDPFSFILNPEADEARPDRNRPAVKSHEMSQRPQRHRDTDATRKNQARRRRRQMEDMAANL